MIDQDKRTAIYYLHKEGIGIRAISRQMGISVNTVSTIIDRKGVMPDSKRGDKITVDSDLLVKLYTDCEGWVQRIHEKLTEEHDIQIGYSTLTRLIREQGLGVKKNQRCDQVKDEPGEEMQHDTTTYMLKVGGKRIKVVASIVYFRYSKIRYLKFYRSFKRFRMKCFLHEAFTFWGYAAPICIIDNTNLARLRGTGRNAVIVPEMKQFAASYGFEFICHEKGHANRKAGNEKSFHTVETNFLPGREFESLEDLNKQALEWATIRMANRPVSKTRLIPAKAFEYEKAYLTPVPKFVPPPYLVYERCTDQYGYASFAANYYWIPGTARHKVTILEYSEQIKIYHKRKLIAEYRFPPDGIRNEKFSPDGHPQPKYQPNSRKKPTLEKEKRLRAAAEEIGAYLDFVPALNGRQRHRFIRELYSLYRKLALPLFVKAIKRSLKYRITDIATIERIAVLQMQDGIHKLPYADVDAAYQDRESYLEGCFTDKADLTVYDKLEDDNE